MKATRYCLAVVRRGQPAGRAKLGEDVAEVSDFLVSHIEELLEGAAADVAPIAHWRDGQRQGVFESLRTGSDDEFVDSAELLTRELVVEMGHVNSKEGVLVCATFEHDGDATCAALKLQVVSDHGAVLERLDSGEVVLSAVERVLDRPGELQKGLVYPDRRVGSDVVIGDKANQTEARYFLVGMGVTAEEHAKRALGAVAQSLVDAVSAAHKTAVLRKLAGADPGTVGQVVEQATEGIELDRPVGDLVAELEGRERPIRHVNTRAALKATITAGTVKVDLRSTDLDRVRIDQASEGGWDIHIHVDEVPVLRHHS